MRAANQQHPQKLRASKATPAKHAQKPQEVTQNRNPPRQHPPKKSNFGYARTRQWN